MIKKLTALILFCLFSSVSWSQECVEGDCNNVQEITLYERITSNIPQLKQQKEVYLGDRMLIQREGDYRECILTDKTYKNVYAYTTFTIKRRSPLCKNSINNEFYRPVSYSLWGPSTINEFEGDNWVKLVKKKDKYEFHICFKQMLFGIKCPRKLRVKDISFNEIEFNNRYFIDTENTSQKTIEYSGRDKDNLKFTYSEFTDSLNRQTFAREFQIDYAKTDVVAYKGAIIKIHDATDVNIVYEVIRNFQD